MNVANERRLASCATELGESASPAVFPELAEFTRSESPLVRRLAASALGKLAGIVDSATSVDLEDNMDYQIGMMEKKKLYRQAGKKVVSLYASEKPRLREVLREKLSRHTRLPMETDLVEQSLNAEQDRFSDDNNANEEQRTP